MALLHRAVPTMKLLYVLYTIITACLFPQPSSAATFCALGNQTSPPPEVRISYEADQRWLASIVQQAQSSSQPLHPVLEEFQTLIDTNPRVYMLFETLFEEERCRNPHNLSLPAIQDSQHLLRVFNYFLTTAPSWDDYLHRTGLVGIPFFALLKWPVRNPAGHTLFLDPDVNAMIKKTLDAWSTYLSSPASATVLSGWLSSVGLRELTQHANLGNATAYRFDEAYVCDPAAPYLGFESWDAYFTREFRAGVRPVHAAEDDSVITNACESTPTGLQRDVAARDHFWIKGRPYSMLDMLGRDPLADRFIGGTVYQGFLTTLGYHRWHAPVSGRIVRTYTLNGTYFSMPPFVGANDVMYSEADVTPYMAAVATRSVVFIQADHPAIGVVGFVAVGMGEVSTCEVTVREGQHVAKGDQLGMFHYGGSTHCLVFENGVKVDGFPDLGSGKTVPVRSKLAVVRA